MHPIMDWYSPEHGYKVWGGMSGYGNLIAAAGHGIREFFSSIPTSIDNLTGAEGDLQSYYSYFESLSE